jgi:hypothetical protein
MLAVSATSQGADDDPSTWPFPGDGGTSDDRPEAGGVGRTLRTLLNRDKLALPQSSDGA